MESLANFPNGEWEYSFNKLFSIDDHLDFSFPLEHDEGLSFINPEINEILLPSSNTFDYNSLATYDLTGSNHVAVTNDITMSFESFPPLFPNTPMEGTVNNVIEDLNTKKRLRAISKGCKNVQRSKKNRNEGECNNYIGVERGHSSSTTCSSEDDSVCQDINNNGGGATSDTKASQALNLNGKARASRGSATDPQSLYARKRRERINERLRILQNLVPNGTKVDISTMLEEAVDYVKFLQLQIKLLSSDDLWMYAPIAYNGVDVALNKKISTLL
ncbi:hypothetical protein ES319_D06G025100v1 [Gossypium barbadense]|uniref:BHLH domain-containing protein n=2 Tax=Gossypium TaxID=3633 RepID=A0A5J5QWU2_GOSBA|nr:hypothetical protein ES319_D06G025100v1 [Gossypium barbadense]PPE01262.1 hypothetical protein GOBAR_DD01756 [Gossypium barbadense]TYG63399.1 hypothetical protein ES288_D06G026900v1 [Gossypium darwinii]